MEFLKSRIRRSKIGEIAYFAINAILPIVILLLVRNFDSAYPALILVLLSKWRIFALRPRFWWINVKANLVDILVSISTVGLLYLSMSSLTLQIVLTIGYGFWLLYLKPRSSISAMMRQAGVAQFLALTVLFSLSTILNEFFVVLGCWLIGYVAARHIISNYDEEYAELLSMLWGFVVAQFGWLLYAWTNVYDLQLPIKIPQISLLLMVISFAVARLYVADKTNRLSDGLLRLTLSFSGMLIAIILVFSRWDITI